MSQLERSQPMSAYAQTFGDPDAETTSRMRKNLRRRLDAREAARLRRRHWMQAGLAAAGLAAIAGGLLWTQSRADPGEPAAEMQADDSGVVSTLDAPQRLDLAHGGGLELDPRTRVRVLADEDGRTALELLDGSLRARPAGPGHAFGVQLDRYRVEAAGATFSVRRTRGVPLVTVDRGFARLFGPDLPVEGIRLRPAE